ncbi:MAG TPA: hypothetical protein VHM93_00100 [Candidatus Acidoferrum sp.]|nr:hypothetical protein [Candidatus Acidoferrum sp.]
MRLRPSPFVIPGGRPAVAAIARDHENIHRGTAGGSSKSAILRQVARCVASALGFAPWAVDMPQPQIPSIFKPEDTPAESVFQLSLFVPAICAFILFFLIVYAGMKFRLRRQDGRERAGSGVWQQPSGVGVDGNSGVDSGGAVSGYGAGSSVSYSG